MKNSKRISSIIAGSVLVASAIATPAYVISTAAFAEEVTEDGEANAPALYVGVDRENIYTTSGCSENAAHTAKYCADGATLTLNGYKDYVINGVDLSAINIILKGDNVIIPAEKPASETFFQGDLLSFMNATVNVAGEANSTLSIGAPAVEPSGSNAISVLRGGVINTIQGVTFNLDASFAPGYSHLIPRSGSTITITDSTINLTGFTAVTELANGGATFNNSKIISTDNKANVGVYEKGDIVINGGEYQLGDINNIYGSIIFNGGKIHTTQLDSKNELVVNDGTNLTVEGDQFSWISGGTVKFLGGTTIINSVAAGLVTSSNPIVYGEGVCINLLDSKIYGSDDNDIFNTNPGEMASVTINKGACINPEGDPTGGNGTGIVPNTGFETSKAIVATIIALPTLIAAAILGRFFYRRYSQRVSFKK